MSDKTLEDHLRDAYFAREADRATFERRGHVGERGNGEAERQSPREQSDRAMWDFVKSKPPPSARGSVTVRRPDGTTITCDVAQLQEVLEQVHKVRPRPIEITCTALADEHAVAAAARGKLDQAARMVSKCDPEMVPHVPEIPIGFGPGIGMV